MRGLELRDGRVGFRDDLPEPAPAPGEVRVDVTRAGVCATDLALMAGYMGFDGVLGHEFVGRATEGRLAGKRVVGEINAACGRCPTCLGGQPRHCPKRSVLGILERGGAFAETLCLPEENLHEVPDAVPDEAACFVEPLAAAFQIPAELALERGSRALVIGDGRLGLLCARVLVLSGLEVTLAGRHPERAALAPGALHVQGLFEDGASALGHEQRRDLVVEASGNPAVLQRALAWVRPKGTLVLKTTAARPASLDLAPLVVDEIRLVGSRCGPFEPALAALASGEVDVRPFVDGRYPLCDGVAALERAARPGTLKILLEVS